MAWEEIEPLIRAIYQEVEEEIARAGPTCQVSGRCCRFGEYGHVLFVSNLEADLLLRHAPRYTQPVAADSCPFQQGKLCTAREHRPLGCRVFYCDPGYQETGQAITEKYLRQLKQLADRMGIGWEYAPLHTFLNRANRGT